jgi:hypothetical protein
MNGRNRLLNMLNGKPKEGLSWTTLVDDTTCSPMSRQMQEMSTVEFYKFIGCDIFQFGNYGLLEGQGVSAPCRWTAPNIQIDTFLEGEIRVRKTKTPWGELIATFKRDHPLKYPVECIHELRILKKVWSDATYAVEDAGDGGYQQISNLIGEDGIYAPTVDQSPIQHLLEYEMGMENFYYLLQDHKVDMEELLEVMHHCRLREYEILAKRTPAEAIISVENTSTTLISPALYKKYTLPHLQDFVNILHAHNKKAILHMCGLLKRLLPLIKQTGMDGIHALTPPWIGDTPYEYAWDILGDSVTLIGCLDSEVFHNPQATRVDIFALLDKIYTPRLRGGNFSLAVVADGLPTPLEKFLWVREWMDRNQH